MIRAGFAEKVITPPIPAYLAGYFHERIGESVRDELYAKAAVFEADGQQVALVVCDLLHVTAEIVEPAKDIIAERVGIPPESVMISATHTHTGPELSEREVAPVVVPIDRDYVATLAPTIAAAVEEAASQMFEAQLRAKSGYEAELSFNRLLRMRDGTDQFGWHGDPREVAGISGPIDPEMVVLGAYDQASNLRGVLTNFALHVDVIGGSGADFVSADWPGELAKTIKANYGDQVTTLLLQGTCGDINHCTHDETELPTALAPKAVQLGRALGAVAINAVEKAEPSPDETLGSLLQILDIPYYQVDDDLRKVVAQLKEEGTEGDFERFLVEKINEWPCDGQIAQVPVQAIRIGPLGIAALSGEFFVHWGLTIKHWSPAPYTMVVELANDSFGYIPTIEQAERGGYGAMPILSRQLEASAGRVISDEVLRMMNQLWEPEQSSASAIPANLAAAMEPYAPQEPD